jgi:hypothetical protein
MLSSPRRAETWWTLMRQIGCPARINKRVFAARVGAVKPRGRLRVRRVSNRNLPMFDIRLTTPDLELRHLTESDLDSLAAIFPEDVELDPSSTTYDVSASAQFSAGEAREPGHQRATRPGR